MNLQLRLNYKLLKKDHYQIWICIYNIDTYQFIINGCVVKKYNISQWDIKY